MGSGKGIKMRKLRVYIHDVKIEWDESYDLELIAHSEACSDLGASSWGWQ